MRGRAKHSCDRPPGREICRTLRDYDKLLVAWESQYYAQNLIDILKWASLFADAEGHLTKDEQVTKQSLRF